MLGGQSQVVEGIHKDMSDPKRGFFKKAQIEPTWPLRNPKPINPKPFTFNPKEATETLSTCEIHPTAVGALLAQLTPRVQVNSTRTNTIETLSPKYIKP